MSEKQNILGRVREALHKPTDSHVRERSLDGGHAQRTDQPTNELPVLNPEEMLAQRTEFLPPVGNDLDEQIDLFAELSAKLQTDFQVVDSMEAATDIVKKLATDNGWQTAAFHSHALVQPIVDAIALETLSTDQAYDAKELEQCDVGISACEALIAQTASVLVTVRSSGGRALSVLPPHHVVIATSEQMLGSMVAGYRLLHEKYAGNWPSFISFITGPSRTADVERVLVLGAHGPKKLTVILIRD